VAGDETLNYLILDHLAGSDLEVAIGNMSDADQETIGAAVSRFLRSLHRKSSRFYDIGLYVPRIPQFRGSWKEGHRQFWGLLRGDLEGLSLDRGITETVERSFAHMSTIEDCLDGQAGSALLHNDFHPKNIIVADGAFSGVIDWECSQFGEPDFDLVHLVHWTVFPPKEVDYHHITKVILADQAKALLPARIISRLTIYEIEHEICQLIWSQGKDAAERDTRLRYWLADGVNRLFSELRVV
jgi:Ser/Thr protein kinase RdoA (MazF antagonist)